MRKNKTLSGGFLYKFREKNFNFFCAILALSIFFNISESFERRSHSGQTFFF